MRKTLLPLLACPHCHGELTCTPFSPEENGHIESGVFTCASCHTAYPLVASIPRFLPNAFSFFPTFIDTYTKELTAAKISLAERKISSLKKDTIESFGSEWETWKNFGWGDGQTKDSARRMFDYKVLFAPEEIQGKLVLDAGCGNGRYSKIALDYGAHVVSVDLSHAVDVAYHNLHTHENAHIVQGDLFSLPFKKETFDFIFSNGVLMHTGNARRAFLSLIPLLKSEGKITIHLYHKGNVIYETIDAVVRMVTTRLPLSLMYRLSRIGAAVARMIPRTFLDKVVNSFVRFEPHAHYIFDWYTAPIATHHTYPEVYKWLQDAHLFLHHDHNKTRYPFIRRWLSPFLFMTVKAGKSAPEGEPRHTTT